MSVWECMQHARTCVAVRSFVALTSRNAQRGEASSTGARLFSWLAGSYGCLNSKYCSATRLVQTLLSRPA